MDAEVVYAIVQGQQDLQTIRDELRALRRLLAAYAIVALEDRMIDSPEASKAADLIAREATE